VAAASMVMAMAATLSTPLLPAGTWIQETTHLRLVTTHLCLATTHLRLATIHLRHNRMRQRVGTTLAKLCLLAPSVSLRLASLASVM
jgi:hypothetical protein